MKIKLLINNSTFEVWAKVITDDNGQLNVEVLSDRLRERLTHGGIYVPRELETEEMRNNKRSYVYLNELEKNPHQFTRFFLDITCKYRFQKPYFSWKAAEDYKGAEEERRLKEKAIQRTNIFFREAHIESKARGITGLEAMEYVTNERLDELVHQKQVELTTKKMEDLSSRKKVPKTPLQRSKNIKTPLIQSPSKKKNSFTVPFKINP